MIGFTGQDGAQTVGVLVLGAAVVGLIILVVAGVAKRNGSPSVALDLTRTFSIGWLVLLGVGVPFAIYSTLLSANVLLTAPVDWPEARWTDVSPDGPLLFASFGEATLEISELSLGPRLLLVSGKLLQLVALAAPAVPLLVLANSALRGKPFVAAVPRWFMIAAVVLLLAGSAQEVLTTLGNIYGAREVLPSGGVDAPPGISLQLPAWPLCGALALAALAAVFRHGIRLQQEKETLQRETEGLV